VNDNTDHCVAQLVEAGSSQHRQHPELITKPVCEDTHERDHHHQPQERDHHQPQAEPQGAVARLHGTRPKKALTEAASYSC
jgi:hypothetical protein